MGRHTHRATAPSTLTFTRLSERSQQRCAQEHARRAERAGQAPHWNPQQAYGLALQRPTV
eukprot:14087693-Alexandrium_andersonii.AAC.1